MTDSLRSQMAMALAVVCISGISLGQAAAQDEASTSSSSTAAYVYVQTHQGVMAYNASSAGKLTLIKGSPFATTGQMAGDNGGYFISTGTDYIHSYKVESNGAIGPQASEINTQSYAGANCGTTDGMGSKLDHTGKYFYVQLYGATVNDGGNIYTPCDTWQSYKINSSGQFTFLGDQENTDGYHGNAFTQPIYTISSNDKFAYGSTGDVYASQFTPFTINSNGELVNNTKFTEKDPPPSGTDDNYYPLLMAADPSEHLAVLMYEYFAQNPPPAQLASYSINSSGGISSTNTSKNMPTPGISNCCMAMSMSTSGKLLAVGGTSGLQVFHFNGASPITSFTPVLLTEEDTDYIAWDNNNHLYVLTALGPSNEYNLHVFNATTTSVTEAAGSPYNIQNVYGVDALIVVPK